MMFHRFLWSPLFFVLRLNKNCYSKLKLYIYTIQEINYVLSHTKTTIYKQGFKITLNMARWQVTDTKGFSYWSLCTIPWKKKQNPKNETKSKTNKTKQNNPINQKKNGKEKERNRKRNISNVLALVGLKLYKISENCRPQKDLLSLQNSAHHLATPLSDTAFLHAEIQESLHWDSFQKQIIM